MPRHRLKNITNNWRRLWERRRRSYKNSKWWLMVRDLLHWERASGADLDPHATSLNSKATCLYSHVSILWRFKLMWPSDSNWAERKANFRQVWIWVAVGLQIWIHRHRADGWPRMMEDKSPVFHYGLEVEICVCIFDNLCRRKQPTGKGMKDSLIYMNSVKCS